MRVVLDASVVIGWFAEQPHSPDAEPWLLAIAGQPDLVVAPDLLWFEVHGALARLAGRGARGAAWAKQAFARFERLAIDRRSTDAACFARAMALATSLRIGGWDAIYLAHAEAVGAPWLTADTRVVRRLRGDARIAALADTPPR